MRWCRSPSAAPRATGGGYGAGGGGRVGRMRAYPAPEPSLGLASHVNLEHLVSGLPQYCERGGVYSHRRLRKSCRRWTCSKEQWAEGGYAGNELPREGPCRWQSLGYAMGQYDIIRDIIGFFMILA